MLGHVNKSIISYRNMIDSGFILMRQNSMANSKAKAEKANRENNVNGR